MNLNKLLHHNEKILYLMISDDEKILDFSSVLSPEVETSTKSNNQYAIDELITSIIDKKA